MRGFAATLERLGLPQLGRSTSTWARPRWLADGLRETRVRLRARVWDYLVPHSQDDVLASTHLVEWLRAVGFDVQHSRARLGVGQYENACGIVASNVVHRADLAEANQSGGWWRFSADEAASMRCIAEANNAHTQWADARPAEARDRDTRADWLSRLQDDPMSALELERTQTHMPLTCSLTHCLPMFEVTRHTEPLV